MRNEQRWIMGAVSRDLGPGGGRLGNRDYRRFYQDEFHVGNGLRTALKPV